MSIVMCGPQCTTEQKNSNGGCGDKQETYIGAVLDIWERNGSWDSDFYALVWDNMDERCKVIEYASTRCWTYHNGAHVDAGESVQRRAREWFIPKVRENQVALARIAAMEVKVGDIVRSTTKRGKNVGVEGMVRRIEIDRYKSTSWSTHYRYAVEVIGEDSYRWLSDASTEKVNVEPINEPDINLAADRWTWTINFRSLTHLGFGL